MIWFLLPIPFALWGWYRWIRNERLARYGNAWFALFLGAAIAPATVVFVAFIGNLIFLPIIGSHCEFNSSSPLLNLSSDTGISGSFFLGSGSVESKPVFYYYEDTGAGIKLDYAKASSSRIFQGEDEPRVEYFDSVTNNKFWFAGGFETCGVDFYIPENSIVNNYKLGE